MKPIQNLTLFKGFTWSGFFHNNEIVFMRIANWTAYLIVLILSLIWGKSIPPNHHEFSIYDINHQYSYVDEAATTVPMPLLMLLSVALPLGLTSFVIFLVSDKELRIKFKMFSIFFTSLLASVSTQSMIVCVLKNICGLPRPDMIARCNPNEELAELEFGFTLKLQNISICQTDNVSLLNEGFRSFVSGHSSTIFTSSTLVTIFNHQVISMNQGKKSTNMVFVKSFLIISPFILAIYVSLTRIKDNRHFLIDVIGGAIIGIGTAITYVILIPVKKYTSISIEAIL